MEIPTKCRLVAYWPSLEDRKTMQAEGEEWLAAVVVSVVGSSRPDLVRGLNLLVLDREGNTHKRDMVGFVGGDVTRDHYVGELAFCSWVPGSPRTGRTYDIKLSAEDGLIERIRAEVKLLIDQELSKLGFGNVHLVFPE